MPNFYYLHIAEIYTVLNSDLFSDWLPTKAFYPYLYIREKLIHAFLKGISVQ